MHVGTPIRADQVKAKQAVSGLNGQSKLPTAHIITPISKTELHFNVPSENSPQFLKRLRGMDTMLTIFGDIEFNEDGSVNTETANVQNPRELMQAIFSLVNDFVIPNVVIPNELEKKEELLEELTQEQLMQLIQACMGEPGEKKA